MYMYVYNLFTVQQTLKKIYKRSTVEIPLNDRRTWKKSDVSEKQAQSVLRLNFSRGNNKKNGTETEFTESSLEVHTYVDTSI